MKILVLGGGPAAHAAALSARTASPAAEIVMCTREAIAPYRRPALSRYVRENVPDDEFFLAAPGEYAARRIDLRTDTEIGAVDVPSHTVFTQSGEKIGYDRLIFCTGSGGFIPPLPGAEQFPPQLLRSYRDCMAIRKVFAVCRSAVILGGGLLGLELADSLRALGGEITVIEAGAKLLNKQLAPAESDRLLFLAEECGIRFLLGDAPVRFLADGVELSSGAICRAGMVCAACGVRPAIALALQCGIPCGRGITVDEHLRTGTEDVFAAGDCVELAGRLSGFYAPACRMGEIAGANAAGGDMTFAFAEEPPLYWRGLGVQIADGKVGRLA